MNTINGNFIERVIPNIKNATLNLLIGDQLATMNLADFQAAIAPSYTSSKGLKMKDNLPLDGTLNNVVDSSDVVTISPLQLSTEAVGLSRTVNLSAGATTPRLFNVAYTINNSGAQTGTLTGLFLNATETALNGITHNLMDLQVGGVSNFRVANNSTAFIGTKLGLYNNSSGGHPGVGTIGAFNLLLTAGSFTTITCEASTGNVRIYSNLQLGGFTSSFPMIKRNGAAIDFRLADDSGYCNLTASTVNGNGIVCLSAGGVGISQISNVTTYGFHMSRNFVVSWGSNTQLDGSLDTAIARYSANVVRISNASTGAGNLFIGASTGYNASAVLQADSTTQGFLPPRMTTAQVNAIATPAEGLQVYNTTINHMCFYMGGVWVRINHSPM